MERAKTSPLRLEEPAYTALRIIAGLMFSTHGMQKIFGWFGAQMHPPAGSLLWFAGMIELICGLLIAVGLFTRPAAFLAAGQMAVAYFAVHWKLQMGEGKWLPLLNHGELAALYSLLFLFILAHGAGAISMDAALRRTRIRGQPRTSPVQSLAGEHGGE
jgi:putative oxidoreductase